DRPLVVPARLGGAAVEGVKVVIGQHDDVTRDEHVVAEHEVQPGRLRPRCGRPPLHSPAPLVDRDDRVVTCGEEGERLVESRRAGTRAPGASVASVTAKPPRSGTYTSNDAQPRHPVASVTMTWTKNEVPLYHDKDADEPSC